MSKKIANTLTLWLFLITAVLIFFGLISLYSALLGQYRIGPDISIAKPLFSQIFALLIGAGLVSFIRYIPVDFFQKHFITIFVVTTLFALSVFLPQLSIDESVFRRIDIFGLTFQPTELLKIGVVIATAAILAGTSKKGNLNLIQILFISFVALTIILFAFFQPDYGTALIIMLSLFAMTFVSRVKFLWYLIGGIIISSILAIILYSQSYTLDRITTFFKLSSGELTQEEIQGSAYQLLQAQNTIGSGGVFGRGFAKGAQKFGFLPESTTDQIFSLVLEETGFVGGIFIVLLFSSFVFIGLRISMKSKNEYGKLLGVGITMLVGTQAFINMMIPLNLFPNTGIPLPFFSKGGSVIIGTMIIIGLLASISQSSRMPNK